MFCYILIYVFIFSYLMLFFAMFCYVSLSAAVSRYSRFAPPQNEIVNEMMSEYTHPVIEEFSTSRSNFG